MPQSEPGWDYGYARSPYFEFDHEREAVYTLYNRRLMPLAQRRGGNRLDDYWVLRTGVGHWHTGELLTEIKGPDAEKLCNLVFTKDIAKLRTGRCTYALACYPHGGLIVDGILMRLASDRFWYVQADGDLFSWLIAHGMAFDVDIFDPNVWVNQVQGPLSMALLAEVVDEGLPEQFDYFGIADVSIGGQWITITRTGWTGELGWEYYANPDSVDCKRLWLDIMKGGESFGLVHASLDSMEIRRIEAAILNAGSDFDANSNPYQVGLGQFVDTEKNHFVGQAALRSVDRRPLLHGLRCGEGEAVIGGAVHLLGRTIGKVTASAWSPYLQCGVGFARLNEPGHRAGTEVTVECIDGVSRCGQLVKLSFYDSSKAIARGRMVAIPKRP